MARPQDQNFITWSGGGPGTGTSAYAPKPPPTQYTPWGPASGGASYTNTAPKTFGPAAATKKAPGVLTKPGPLEEVWGGIRGRLEAPSMTSGYAAGAMPQLQAQSNLEKLYESGYDNPWFARARDKGMREIENRMSAAGVFGSGANAKAMLELEADLGARQANEMIGLAGAADNARLARFGEARTTATGADSVNLNRDLGLANIGGNVQDAWIDRERAPFQDSLALGSRFADVFTQMRSADLEEQGRLRENMIQSLVAEGQLDYERAAGAIDEALAGAGLFVNAYGSGQKKPATTTTAPAPGGSGSNTGHAQGNYTL